MPSTIETGHAKNVAIFQDLISFCKGFGATYNPSSENLKLAALNPQLAAAKAALQAVQTSKAVYDTATNEREIAIANLKPLSTKIINAMVSAMINSQTVDDARTVLNKIHGKRAKKVVVPSAQAIAEGAEPVRTASTAQGSYDKLVDHFSQLIEILKVTPKYSPNENELKVTTLSAQLEDMRDKNLAVSNAWTDISNARINRNNVLYAKETGMVDVAQAVKVYMKSVVGPKNPKYKQLTGLQFTKRVSD